MANIIVVEDNVAIAMVMQITLSDEGHNVKLLKNAREALTLMQNGFIPDLVLTDLIMGGMNGRDLIVKMREDTLLRSVPAVIITGCVPKPEILPEADQFQGLLNKPFDLDELVSLVESLIHTEAA